MKKVNIKLEFECDDTTEKDVIEYLQELINQGCLYFEIESDDEDYVVGGSI